jgi:hypothetical protein
MFLSDPCVKRKINEKIENIFRSWLGGTGLLSQHLGDWSRRLMSSSSKEQNIFIIYTLIFK